MPATETNRDVVLRFYKEALEDGDVGACERLIDPSYVFNGEAMSPAEQQQIVEGHWSAFPDLGHEFVQVVAEDDLVAIRHRWWGTHEGPYLGVPASGRKVEFTTTSIYRVRDGRIAEIWDDMDTEVLRRQMTG
jgi:steroid delta-isomerase-like uncharacterized protein